MWCGMEETDLYLSDDDRIVSLQNVFLSFLNWFDGYCNKGATRPHTGFLGPWPICQVVFGSLPCRETQAILIDHPYSPPLCVQVWLVLKGLHLVFRLCTEVSMCRPCLTAVIKARCQLNGQCTNVFPWLLAKMVYVNVFCNNICLWP